VVEIDDRVEKLESALAGAMRAGDFQADEIVRLTQTVFRQRSAMRRVIALAERGQVAVAIGLLKDELYKGDYK
jgi:hypothetical protein